MNKPLTVLMVTTFAVIAGCALVEPQMGPEITVNFNVEQVPGDTAVVDGDTIVFRRIAPGHLPENLPPIKAEALEGGVRVNGYFLAAVLGQRLEANVTRNGDIFKLQVWAVDVSGPDMPQPYLYEAQLIAVPAGTYRVAVVHIGDVMRDHAAGAVTVLDEDVRVR